MDEILQLLSLRPEHVQYIIKETEDKLKDSLASRKKEAEAKGKYIREINHKIEKLEQRLMDDEIEGATYKKWYRKYSEERSESERTPQDLRRDDNQRWKQTKQALPHLLSMPKLYERANLKQKHLLLNEVFKHGLMYSEGRVRTPSINPVFSHNMLKIK